MIFIFFFLRHYAFHFRRHYAIIAYAYFADIYCFIFIDYADMPDYHWWPRLSAIDADDAAITLRHFH